MSEEGDTWPPKHEFKHDVKMDVEARVRQGVKAILEEILQEEMTEHLKAGYGGFTSTRRGERNGHYTRNLVTPAGRIEHLEVPRDREGEFVELYGKRFPRAVAVFEAGINDALSYLSYPGSHHARLRTTNMLERLFEEVKRRTKVVGVFPSETSAATLATEIALRSSEQWALKRYLSMDALKSKKPNPQHSRH